MQPAHCHGANVSRRQGVPKRVCYDRDNVNSHCIDEDQALGMIDGTLTSEERTGIERHIDTCSACRELLSGLAQQSVFSGKPSPSSFPASAAFAATQRALPETRNVALGVSVPRALVPRRTPISAPPPSVPAQSASASRAMPEKVASNAPFLIALGLGLGSFAFALLVIALGAAGLFYAGGRLVAEPEPHITPVQPAPPAPIQERPAQPAFELPRIPGVTESFAYEHIMCSTDMGLLAHHTYVTEGVTPALQAMRECHAVLDDVTLRRGDALSLVVYVVGDETIVITIRNSRIEGDVLVAGAAHVRFENCEIHGALNGSMDVIRSRHEGARSGNVRFLP